MEIKLNNNITPVYINSETIINGELIFGTDARVEGRLLGSVRSLENKIVIGSEGYVTGRLDARELIVFGKLEGEITVSGTTVIHSGGFLQGRLNSRIVDIKEGAILNAKFLTDANQRTIEKSLPFPETAPVNSYKKSLPLIEIKPDNSTSFLKIGIQMIPSHGNSDNQKEWAIR